MNIVKQLRAHRACIEAVQWVKKEGCTTIDEVIAACPRTDWLAWAVVYLPVPWPKRAAAKLMARDDATNDDLRDIIHYAPDPWPERARDVLHRALQRCSCNIRKTGVK